MSLSVCAAFKQSSCDGFDAFLHRFGENDSTGVQILTYGLLFPPFAAVLQSKGPYGQPIFVPI